MGKKNTGPRRLSWWWLHNLGVCACVCYGEQTAQLVTHSVMPSGCDQTHTHTSRQACSYRAACTLLHTGTHTKPVMKELQCYFLSCGLMRNLDFPLFSHSLFPCPLYLLLPFFMSSLSFSSSSLHFLISSFYPCLCCYLTSLLSFSWPFFPSFSICFSHLLFFLQFFHLCPPSFHNSKTSHVS